MIPGMFLFRSAFWVLLSPFRHGLVSLLLSVFMAVTAFSVLLFEFWLFLVLLLLLFWRPLTAFKFFMVRLIGPGKELALLNFHSVLWVPLVFVLFQRHFPCLCQGQLVALLTLVKFSTCLNWWWWGKTAVSILILWISSVADFWEMIEMSSRYH